MLLGKKTHSTVGSDWAVILDRSNNEYARTRAVEKLADTFNLSPDEAKDLAENTPIILLDQLSLDVAERIKDHFAQSNIDCTLTNDTFSKRKCFRAIWPSQPDLSRVLKDPDLESDGFLESPIQEELSHLTQDLQKENELLRSELEKTVQEPKSSLIPDLEANEEIIEERLQFEEVVNQSKNENQALISKISELEQTLKDLRQTAEKEVKMHYTEFKTQLEHYKSEYARAQNTIKLSQNEAKQFQTELLQNQKLLSQSRAEIEDLKRMLSQMQSNSMQLKEDMEQTKRELENRFENQTAELEEWKRKANDWSSNYFKVMKENEFLRTRQSEELETLRVRNQQLTTQLEQAQRQIREFVVQLEQQELIQKRMRASQEMAEYETQLKILVHKQKTLEDEIRTRDEEMKKVLSEQEMAEKAIINSKQAQKYLMEQAKLKEKSRSLRPKIASPGSLPDSEPSSPDNANND